MVDIRTPNLRFILLLILSAQQQMRGSDVDGWLGEDLLRRLLAAEGYPLDETELRIQSRYLADSKVGCIEIERKGDLVAPRFRYRLTAKGMDVAERREIVKGIGIN